MRRHEIADVVFAAVRKILPGASLNDIGNSHLRDIGADSIDRVEILLLVKQELGFDRPLSAFAAIPDIDGLIDFLTKNQRT
jgi:polyketide biosynthesis acyl carrier protein